MKKLGKKIQVFDYNTLESYCNCSCSCSCSYCGDATERAEIGSENHRDIEFSRHDSNDYF